MYNIFAWKIEKLFNTIFQRMFIFCLFIFLLLSNNAIHVMFYIYICYWNTFQYKYIIQITFHVVKQFMCEWLQSKQSKSNFGKVNKTAKTERESATELTFSPRVHEFERSPSFTP